MFRYLWIQNEETRDYYINKLRDLINSIDPSIGEIKNACSLIESDILAKLEEDINNELITREAYKFLHHYSIYIKEEIEKDFGNCPQP